MTNDEVKADLIAKVREQVQLLESSIPDTINRLDRAGSGVVDDHRASLERGKNYETSNKVQLAILRDFFERSAPPKSLDTKEFRGEVQNYYNLI